MKKAARTLISIGVYRIVTNLLHQENIDSIFFRAFNYSMNLFVTLYAVILFVVLTPGILLTLPKGGSKLTVAVVHGVVFTLVYNFTYNTVWKTSLMLDGFQNMNKKDGFQEKKEMFQNMNKKDGFQEKKDY